MIRNIPDGSGHLVDAAGNITNPAREDGNLANLDALLSTRATAANQTNGTQRAGLLDGSGNPITSTVDGAKRRLDARMQSEGATEATAPAVATLVGGQGIAGNLHPARIFGGALGGLNPMAVSSLHHSRVASYLGRLYQAGYSVNHSGTAELDDFLIRNPAGSGKLLVFCFTVWYVFTADRAIYFRFYWNPTVTANGTAVTPQSTRGGATDSVMLFSTAPTVTVRGNSNILLAETWASGTHANEALAFIVDPGDSLLITGAASANNTVGGATIQYGEVDA